MQNVILVGAATCVNTVTCEQRQSVVVLSSRPVGNLPEIDICPSQAPADHPKLFSLSSAVFQWHLLGPRPNYLFKKRMFEAEESASFGTGQVVTQNLPK